MNNITPEEMWKDIEGYEGLYMISNMGRVWSHVSDRILKRYCSSNGYEHVNLRKDGESTFHQTHTLVANAFVENPNKYPCVNHIDENKRNNRWDNLEWCTYHYNAHHGTRIERIRNIIDYKQVAMKNSKPIYQYDLTGNLIRKWESAKECKRETGYDNSNIIKVCRGRMKTAYGYVWKYETDKEIG